MPEFVRLRQVPFLAALFDAADQCRSFAWGDSDPSVACTGAEYLAEGLGPEPPELLGWLYFTEIVAVPIDATDAFVAALQVSKTLNQHVTELDALLKTLVEAVEVEDPPVPPLPTAPFAPRGMTLKKNILYVADAGDDDPVVPGRLTRWDIDTGSFLGDLPDPCLPFNTYHPRGIVLGPDGIYVSSYVSASGPGGHVLRSIRIQAHS